MEPLLLALVGILLIGAGHYGLYSDSSTIRRITFITVRHVCGILGIAFLCGVGTYMFMFGELNTQIFELFLLLLLGSSSFAMVWSQLKASYR